MPSQRLRAGACVEEQRSLGLADRGCSTCKRNPPVFHLHYQVPVNPSRYLRLRGGLGIRVRPRQETYATESRIWLQSPCRCSKRVKRLLSGGLLLVIHRRSKGIADPPFAAIVRGAGPAVPRPELTKPALAGSTP